MDSKSLLFMDRWRKHVEKIALFKNVAKLFLNEHKL